MIYQYFEGYNYTKQEGLYASISFGNMGYSGATCGTNFVNWNEKTTVVNLQCEGTAKIRSVIDSGLVELGQSGPDQRLNEFNRCFYETPISDKFKLMKDFN